MEIVGSGVQADSPVKIESAEDDARRLRRANEVVQVLWEPRSKEWTTKDLSEVFNEVVGVLVSLVGLASCPTLTGA